MHRSRDSRLLASIRGSKKLRRLTRGFGFGRQRLTYEPRLGPRLAGCFAGGGKWIAVAVMLSTFGAANAVILTSARVYYSMAGRGLFPAALGQAHARYHTPGASLVGQAVWSILP